MHKVSEFWGECWREFWSEFWMPSSNFIFGLFMVTAVTMVIWAYNQPVAITMQSEFERRYRTFEEDRARLCQMARDAIDKHNKTLLQEAIDEADRDYVGFQCHSEVGKHAIATFDGDDELFAMVLDKIDPMRKNDHQYFYAAVEHKKKDLLFLLTLRYLTAMGSTPMIKVDIIPALVAWNDTDALDWYAKGIFPFGEKMARRIIEDEQYQTCGA